MPGFTLIDLILPAELWLKIFLLAMSNGKVSPFLFGTVCAVWRKITLNEPVLWCTISKRIGTRDKSRLNRTVDSIEESIRRAGSAPLKLVLEVLQDEADGFVDIWELDDLFPDFSAEGMDRLLRVVLNCAAQIRILKIPVAPKWFESLSNAHFSSLEVLSAHFGRYGGVDGLKWDLSRCPLLYRIDADCSGGYQDLLFIPPWRQIRDFRVGGWWYFATEDRFIYNSILELPTLRHLTISGYESPGYIDHDTPVYDHHTAYTQSVSQTCLARLESLDISQYDSYGIAQILKTAYRAPLHTLSIMMNHYDEQPDQFNNFLSSALPPYYGNTLRRLSLTRIAVPTLLSMMKALPLLEEVKVVVGGGSPYGSPRRDSPVLLWQWLSSRAHKLRIFKCKAVYIEDSEDEFYSLLRSVRGRATLLQHLDVSQCFGLTKLRDDVRQEIFDTPLDEEVYIRFEGMSQTWDSIPSSVCSTGDSSLVLGEWWDPPVA